MAERIELWPVERLKPYDRNARTHSDAQVTKIAASIAEFGFTNPILVDSSDGIIAGHGRLMAAQRLGMTEVPVVVLDHLTDAQRRAYILADNRLALDAGWDEAMLAAELADLQMEEFDLSLTGFSDEELADLLPDDDAGEDDEGGDGDDEATPDVPAQPVTVPGDVWLLGKHRVMCGDSTSVDAVDALMCGASADVCFTSPPYGQQRDYGAAKDAVQDWDNLMAGVFSILPVTDSAQVLVNLGLIHRDCEWQPYWSGWLEMMRDAGWRRFGLYVWDQGPGLPGDWAGRLAPSFELIFHFNKNSIEPNKWVEKKPESIREKTGTGLRRADGTMSGVSNPSAGMQPTKIPDSVIRVNRQATERMGHPAAFPVALSEYILATYSCAGQSAYEPFMGSGTTLIACENMDIACFGMEMDPRYCDVIVKRWEKFTGKRAKLESTGQTFSDVAAGRGVEIDELAEA